MNKKMAVLIAFLALLISVLPAIAKGPHPKATGTVELSQPGRFLEFNAHETDPAKGEVHWWRIFADGSRADFYAKVTEINVETDYARIDGVVYSSTFGNIDPGFTFYFEVWDNATPGAGTGFYTPDKVFWQWVSGISASQNYDVVDGNLKVHTYE